MIMKPLTDEEAREALIIMKSATGFGAQVRTYGIYVAYYLLLYVLFQNGMRTFPVAIMFISLSLWAFLWIRAKQMLLEMEMYLKLREDEGRANDT